MTKQNRGWPGQKKSILNPDYFKLALSSMKSLFEHP